MEDHLAKRVAAGDNHRAGGVRDRVGRIGRVREHPRPEVPGHDAANAIVLVDDQERVLLMGLERHAMDKREAEKGAEHDAAIRAEERGDARSGGRGQLEEQRPSRDGRRHEERSDRERGLARLEEVCHGLAQQDGKHAWSLISWIGRTHVEAERFAQDRQAPAEWLVPFKDRLEPPGHPGAGRDDTRSELAPGAGHLDRERELEVGARAGSTGARVRSESIARHSVSTPSGLRMSPRAISSAKRWVTIVCHCHGWTGSGR